MAIIVEVEEDQIVFLPIKDNQPVQLNSYGVTTCMCLALYGHTSDAPFIGMYHWSGFNSGLDQGEEVVSEDVYGLVSQLVTAARQQLDLDKDAPLFLDKFFVIGGEQQQEMLRGTEFEVNALKNYIETQCQEEFVFSDATGFYFYNYLTSGEQTLTIRMDHIKPQPHWLVSEVENDLYMDIGSDTDSFCSQASPNFR